MRGRGFGRACTWGMLFTLAHAWGGVFTLACSCACLPAHTFSLLFLLQNGHDGMLSGGKALLQSRGGGRGGRSACARMGMRLCKTLQVLQPGSLASRNGRTPFFYPKIGIKYVTIMWWNVVNLNYQFHSWDYFWKNLHIYRLKVYSPRRYRIPFKDTIYETAACSHPIGFIFLRLAFGEWPLQLL